MSKTNRKMVNLTEEQYVILSDYASDKGISMGEAIEEMSKDIDILKSHDFDTTFGNAKHFCDQLDALAEVSRLPEWLINNIKTIRPIILKEMLRGEEVDITALRASWKLPDGMKLIISFDKE